MREALGDGYAEALRGAWSDVPESADFVMYWWQKAALAVRMGDTRRMGLITTNSLTMIFNRRVIEAALSGSVAAAALPSPSGAEPGHAGALMPRHTPKSGAGTPRPGLRDAHLAFAIPDHPWVDIADGAAVRIAMTVLDADTAPGRLLTVKDELVGENGEMSVTLLQQIGLIHANLKVGAAVASASSLKATQAITSMGVMLAGAGFIIDAQTADTLRASLPAALANRLIRHYRNGRDLTDSPREVSVIDTFGWEVDRLRSDAPAIYQLLNDRVKPERDAKRDKAFRERWWLHGRARAEMRTAQEGLPRFIATVETAKHRTFQFLDASVLPDHKLIAIALSDAQYLGVLSSVVHVSWTLATGGTLEDRPVYNKSVCFETFPFPADDTGLTPALADRIRSLAEQLDAHRKARQAAHESVTLTGMYNVLDKLRRGEALTVKDKAQHEHALVGVLQSLHDELDTAVLQAYGWSDLGPVPWAQPEARAAWTESLLERLVALNTRRAAEEAGGLIRWLRPEFQDPARRAAANATAHTSPTEQTTLAINNPIAIAAGAESTEDDGTKNDAATPATAPAAAAARAPWPSDLKAQLRSVADLLAASPVALSIDQIADRYTSRGPWKKRLPDLLATLEALARARADGDGWRAA